MEYIFEYNQFELSDRTKQQNSYIELIKTNPKEYLNLLEKGKADYNFNNSIALIQAVKVENIDVVKALLEYDELDISARHFDAFLISIGHDLFEIFKILIHDRRVNDNCIEYCYRKCFTFATTQDTSQYYQYMDKHIKITENAYLEAFETLTTSGKNDEAFEYFMKNHLSKIDPKQQIKAIKFWLNNYGYYKFDIYLKYTDYPHEFLLSFIEKAGLLDQLGMFQQQYPNAIKTQNYKTLSRFDLF
jgi:hypothetical protein